MPRLLITPERYHALSRAFLALGNKPGAVARECGLRTETAKRAWEQGFPSVSYGAPIKYIYADALRRKEEQERREREKGKTAFDSSATEEQKGQSFQGLTENAETLNKPPAVLLQESAINAVQSEIDLLQAFRSNLVGAVLTANKLLVGLDSLAVAAVENLKTQALNPLQVSAGKVLDPLEKFARIINILSSSTKNVMEMQRLLVGAPQSITEQRGVQEVGQDLDDKLKSATRLYGMLQRHGYLPGTSTELLEAAESGEVDTVFEESGPGGLHTAIVSEPTIEQVDPDLARATDGQNLGEVPGNTAKSQAVATVNESVD